jgi:hypothetical protein
MMKRIMLLVTVALVTAAMMVAMAMPAFAQGRGPSACKEFQLAYFSAPGQFISFVAQEVGHSAELNPANAKNEAPPFVPFVVGCNPNATF